MKISRKHREWLWAYAFIAPTVLGIFIFTIGPIFYAFYISLTRWNNITPPQFIGFANYTRMMTDSIFHSEIINTFIFVIISVPLTISISILIAVMLTAKIPAVGFFRTVIFIPYVTLPAAAAMVWENIFNNRFGMINGMLRWLGLPLVDWFGSSRSVMGIIIAMTVWASIGYFSVILMVGIKSLPVSFLEAAKIDGATSVQSFFRITVPLLTPQIFFVTTICMIGAFSMFDAIFIFGRGSVIIRDGIRTMAFGIFDRGFTFQEMGYAASNAVVLLVFIMAVTILQFVSQKYWVHYGE